MNTETQKNKFTMLCGLPGSGKSTLAQSMIDDNTVWLSSDKIREEFYGSEEEQGNPVVVFDEMKKRTIKALREGKDVIYDACNISSKRRMALLRSLEQIHCFKKCIVCATPYEECVRRDANRDRVVGESVIKRMNNSWNPPFAYENWDAIEIHHPDNEREIKEDGGIDDREW